MTENYEGGWWGQNTALWAIVAIIIVIAFLWFCHKTGEDKANLAGSIQQLYGRVNALEPAVTANAQNVYRINNTLAQTVQGVQDIKDDVVFKIGKTQFYRMKNETIGISPLHQRAIKKVFLKYGIEADPVFDRYVPVYPWQ